MDLANGEFALNGYRFGCGHLVDVSTLKATSLRWRVQDQPNPVGDTILMGRDFKDPQPITFGLLLKGSDPEELSQAAAEFANAWDMAEAREPSEESVLELGAHGKTFHVYGRPRDLDIDDTDLFAQRRGTGTAVFDPTDALFYGDPSNGGGGQVTLSITPPSSAGIQSPMTSPITTLVGGKRQGLVVNAGRRPTRDIIVTIKGTVVRPIVGGPGWEMEIDTTLAYDQSIVLDVRNNTIRRNDGHSLAGRLSRKSRFRNIEIPPGNSEFTFRGTSVDGSATATIRWGSAHTTLGV